MITFNFITLSQFQDFFIYFNLIFNMIIFNFPILSQLHGFFIYLYPILNLDSLFFIFLGCLIITILEDFFFYINYSKAFKEITKLIGTGVVLGASGKAGADIYGHSVEAVNDFIKNNAGNNNNAG